VHYGVFEVVKKAVVFGIKKQRGESRIEMKNGKNESVEHSDSKWQKL